MKPAVPHLDRPAADRFPTGARRSGSAWSLLLWRWVPSEGDGDVRAPLHPRPLVLDPSAAYFAAAALTARAQERETSLRRTWRYGLRPATAPANPSLRGRLATGRSSAADLLLPPQAFHRSRRHHPEIQGAGPSAPACLGDGTLLVGRAVAAAARRPGRARRRRRRQLGGVTGLMWIAALAGLGWVAPA